ncbi:hypothetical protein GCM10023152_33730 [Agromyces bauzanensis]|uniref:Uncharacterized protein n=1 Tax=Agromyces bauzanensis TaxID=1308924 RepID=A0A917UXB3_9MICO|nr:hypothetical protein GCM10011372_34020 [Agromyces bauzanensis]
MGQNRRYDLVGRDIERADRTRAERGVALSLSVDEVRVTGRRRDAREPIPVIARLQFQVAHVEPREIEAVAIAWTDAALLVRWTCHDRQEHCTWVYAGAVRRRS